MVWNERAGCVHDVPLLPRSEFDEVFALDGGSTDGTVEYLEGQDIPVIRQTQRGYNRAYIEAFEYATSDALVIFHPKGTIDPRTTAQFIAPFRNGKQLVVASRIIRGSRNEEDDKILKPRKWFVVALATLSALLWWRGRGPIIWDVLHGFRGMSKEAFFAMDPIAEGLSMDLQMVVRAYRLKLQRLELPVREIPRLDGATHFKAVPTGIKLLKYIWFELKRKKVTGKTELSSDYAEDLHVD